MDRSFFEYCMCTPAGSTLQLLSCGRQTYMGLPNMSQIVWAYIMTPTPSGVGHLISPRWLEEM